MNARPWKTYLERLARRLRNLGGGGSAHCAHRPGLWPRYAGAVAPAPIARRAGLRVILWTVIGFASPLAAAPQISQVSPQALVPGKTTEFAIRGQQLLAPRSLWTTFAARTEFVPPTDDAAKKGEVLICRITVPRDEQAGIGAIRLVSAEGVSNAVLVVLDELPSIAEVPDNHTVAQAQPLQLPIAVDGQCDAVQDDVYRFHAHAGQRIAFEVVSQRLGAKLDPVLRLLTADGKQLARSDDTQGSGGDSRFAHTFDSAGDYLLTIGDVRHLGGGDFRYRLRLGSFPLVRTAFPLGGRGGDVVTFDVAGDGIEPDAKIPIALPQPRGPRHLAFVAVPSSGGGSGWFPVEASDAIETVEQEPNNSFGEATPAIVPGVLNGRLAAEGDRDCYRFHARKGQRVHGIVKSRELGSACDVFFSLHRADGTKLAEARQERQTLLAFDIAEDGEYFLQVDDLLLGTSEKQHHAYRIELTDLYAGFTLNAEQLQYNGPQAGTFVMKVLAQRRGYNGPIELAVDGLGEGVGLAGNTFDGTETLLKITLPANLPAGELHHATIVGKAKLGDQVVAVPAVQREPLRTAFPNLVSPPAELRDAVAIGIGPPFPPYFDLSLTQAEVYFPQLVGTSTFDINISRSNEGFKEAVAFTLEGLPKEIAAKVEPVGDGLKAARVTLTGPADLAVAEHVFRITGTGLFQEQSRKVVLDNLKLRITPPLVVSVAMLGPVAAGGPQHAEVKLVRFGADPQPVRLQVADGPEGLSAPIFVNVPADAATVKIPVFADPSAPAGKFDNLIVVATTTVKGQNVKVLSKPATVEIQPAPAK